jgi:hypothetical protein
VRERGTDRLTQIRGMYTCIDSNKNKHITKHQAPLLILETMQGGKLELGDVEECAGGKHRVLCPRHGWAFDLRSGYSEDACDYAIHAYATKVLPGGVVCVSEKPLPQPSIE